MSDVVKRMYFSSVYDNLFSRFNRPMPIRSLARDMNISRKRFTDLLKGEKIPTDQEIENFNQHYPKYIKKFEKEHRMSVKKKLSLGNFKYERDRK